MEGTPFISYFLFSIFLFILWIYVTVWKDERTYFNSSIKLCCFWGLQKSFYCSTLLCQVNWGVLISRAGGDGLENFWKVNKRRRGVVKLETFIRQRHENKELYSLYSSHGNCDAIHGGWGLGDGTCRCEILFRFFTFDEELVMPSSGTTEENFNGNIFCVIWGIWRRLSTILENIVLLIYVRLCSANQQNSQL